MLTLQLQILNGIGNSGQEILKIARLPDFLVARVQDMAGGVEAVYGVTMIPRISAIDPRTKSTM